MSVQYIDASIAKVIQYKKFTKSSFKKLLYASKPEQNVLVLTIGNEIDAI